MCAAVSAAACIDSIDSSHVLRIRPDLRGVFNDQLRKSVDIRGVACLAPSLIFVLLYV